MTEYFCEILLEEIPAWMLDAARASLTAAVEKLFAELGQFTVTTNATPRRLVLFLEHVPARQAERPGGASSSSSRTCPPDKRTATKRSKVRRAKPPTTPTATQRRRCTASSRRTTTPRPTSWTAATPCASAAP